MKSSKGKLDDEIPEPSFLAYPSHFVKVVAKQIFSIVNNGKAQQCVCTNADAVTIKKYWGYMMKKNRSKSLE